MYLWRPMLDKILKLFLGDTSKRTLSEINPIIDSVKAAERELENISDQALRAETEGFAIVGFSLPPPLDGEVAAQRRVRGPAI